MAGDRAGELEFCTAYSDEALMQPTVDVQRHRDALGELASAGIGWAVITRPPGEPSEVIDFIQAFGETYCDG